MAVSAPSDPRRFLVGTGFPFKALEALDAYLAQLGRVLRATSGIRRGGAASVDLAYVANGTLDGFWELFLEPWDVGAGLLLITEAGGCAERLEGGPVDLSTGTVLAACSAESLDALRAIVLGAPPQAGPGQTR
jgi:myo-inositol-1(or 4)-monophosphatase